LTRRLLVGFLLITLVVLAALLVPLGITYAQRQVERVTADIERDAVVIASLAEVGLEDGTVDERTAAMAQQYTADTGARVVIVDQTGIALLDTDPPFEGQRDFSTRPEIAAALDGNVASGSRSSATLGAGFVYVAVPSASGGIVHGAVRVTFPTASVDARVRRNWLTLGVVALVTMGGVAVAGVVIARWVTRPLRDLHDSAVALGAGDLSARVPADSGPPEVRDLANAFNRTASRLEELISSQEAFVADASHELRTPLTALRLRLENLEGELPPSSADDIEAAIAEADRLGRVVAGLLVLARADRPDATITREAVDVAVAFDDRRRTWQTFADERQVAMVVEASAGLEIDVVPDHLTQVLDNLIANALDATPDGSTLRLAAEPADETVVVHVKDEGPGMAADERERAFDRFWRSSHARTRFGGSGLGLAIVAKLVAADGGTVALEPVLPHGLDAVVTWPMSGRPRPAERGSQAGTVAP
jgi:signal transduction histidine kinase